MYLFINSIRRNLNLFLKFMKRLVSYAKKTALQQTWAKRQDEFKSPFLHSLNTTLITAPQSTYCFL